MITQARLIRTYYDNQTLGQLFVYRGVTELLSLKTLELPWKNNEQGISCIPEGEYHVDHRFTKQSRFKYPHFILQQVVNRSYILIHRGNYNTQIRGCILVGTDFKDINDDEVLDVNNSTKALNSLIEVIPTEGFQLVIESISGEPTY
tara:strand:+ start:557 stop:997 length:441 start_codon:yes stop_codon:yes gene_type:complete